MKLGELKIATLMMIFPDEKFEIDFENDEQVSESLFALKSDSNYNAFLTAIPQALNRCFSSLEQKNVIPTKQMELSSTKGEKVGTRLRFRLSEVVPDMGKLEKISFYNTQENIYLDACSYSRESTDSILLEQANGTFVIVYTPQIKRITATTGDNHMIDLPRYITDIIPYFLKSELLRVENPDEASIARNIYEQMVEETVNSQDGYQGQVQVVYGI